MFNGRVVPESGITSRPSGPQFTPEELEDLSVELELPSLDAVIPKDELHRLKKDEKKRQEVINGMVVGVCWLLQYVI